MSRVRMLGAAVLVLGAAAAAALLVSSTPSSEPVNAAQAMTSKDCAECHSEIAKEVAASYHGRAFTDAEYLQLSKDGTDPPCISCHAPTPIFLGKVGDRVLERVERRVDGVDCISCHLTSDGQVAGTRGLTEAPCRPRLEPRLATASFCAGCHNQHWTVDEWMASSWAEKKSCLDCHMRKVDRPIADGGPVREGVRTHLFEGGHFPEMVKEAVKLVADLSGRKIIIRVTNSGAGHKIPTDSRHKSFNLLVSVRDEEGNLVLEHEEVAEYRLYYRPDKIPPTQIEPLETRTHEFELPDVPKGTATIELVYCLKPPQKITKDWMLVKKVEVQF